MGLKNILVTTKSIRRPRIYPTTDEKLNIKSPLVLYVFGKGCNYELYQFNFDGFINIDPNIDDELPFS